MVIREWFANRRLKEAIEKANKRVANSAGVVSAIGQYDVLFGTFHVVFQGIAFFALKPLTSFF
jgi:hypothetical protein